MANKSSWVYVKDLKKGTCYEYTPWARGIPSSGIIQYIGSFRHSYGDGSTWKMHRFLWVKKIENKDYSCTGKTTVELYGDSIRGCLGFM